jgi:hypothetical protein
MCTAGPLVCLPFRRAPFNTDLHRALLLLGNSNICATEVNEAYIAYLSKLNEKMEYAASADHNQVVAFKEMSPHLESLKVKVIISPFVSERWPSPCSISDGSFSSPLSGSRQDSRLPAAANLRTAQTKHGESP